MLTKDDWQEIWEAFDKWFDGNEDWWEEQMPKIQELVNAKLDEKLRAEAPVILPMQVLDTPEPITNKGDSP